MTYIHAILAGHLEWAIYALSLASGALAEAVLLLQRRGFGRGGFGGFGRRRRRGGLLGGLALFFLLGPIVILALVAYFAYALFSGMRRRR
jgi:hypothetical protein